MAEEKKTPESVFAIDNPKDISSANKGMNVESSEEKQKEELVLETKDMTLEDLKSYLQKNNVIVNEQNIENYYNQIVENKKYINEYNNAIKELDEAKKIFSDKNEEIGRTDNPDKTIVSKISELEKRLADLNVEKQKNEDSIKSTINNIFNENKTENSKNVNFETKNNVLNMALNGVQKPAPVEKKIENIENKSKDETKEVEKETTNPTVEKVVEEQPKQDTIAVEKIVEEQPKQSSIAVEKVVEEQPKQSSIAVEKVVEEQPKQSSIAVEKAIEEEKTPIYPPKETKPEIPISDIKKTETDTKKEENVEKMQNDKDLNSLSEEMRKGFESVLSAIQGISKTASQQPQKEEQKQEESKQEPESKQSTDTQNKSKTPQKNYIEEYRQSLRSNVPIDGFVGIKGLHLKANNIGSFV